MLGNEHNPQQHSSLFNCAYAFPEPIDGVLHEVYLYDKM